MLILWFATCAHFSTVTLMQCRDMWFNWQDETMWALLLITNMYKANQTANGMGGNIVCCMWMSRWAPVLLYWVSYIICDIVTVSVNIHVLVFLCFRRILLHFPWVRWLWLELWTPVQTSACWKPGRKGLLPKSHANVQIVFCCGDSQGKAYDLASAKLAVANLCCRDFRH